MTELDNAQQPYRVRLIERFGFYDHVKSQMWHEWQQGAIVTDPREIEILEARGAPVENIFEGEFRR